MENRFTGRLGRLFNAVIPGVAACNAWGSQPLKNTTRFPITTFGNDVGGEYRRGFTLIELLVVVLIIGILSAIALPQYRKAVARSRMAGLITLASSVAQAEQRYFMANGEYTVNAADLDLSLPAGFVITSSGTEYRSYTDGTTRITFYKRGAGGEPRVSVHHTKIPSFVLWKFDPDDAAGKRCGVIKNSQKELGLSICATYGEFWEENPSYIYYRLN